MWVLKSESVKFILNHTVDCMYIVVSMKTINQKFCLFFFTEDSFRNLVGQITSLVLPVIVVWVGPDLKSILSTREQNAQYSLFHNWQPNDISASGHYSRIAFPTCIGEGSDDQTYHGCDYPFHSIEKVLWRGVMNNAPDLQRFVMKMNMSEQNVEDIMKDYHTTPMPMPDFACVWAKNNMRLWWPWIPGRMNRRSPNKVIRSPNKAIHFIRPNIDGNHFHIIFISCCMLVYSLS